MSDPCIGTCPTPSFGALPHTWHLRSANSGAFFAQHQLVVKTSSEVISFPCIRSRENTPLLLASLDWSNTLRPRTSAQNGGHRRYISPSLTFNPLFPCKRSRPERWRLFVLSFRHRTSLLACLSLRVSFPWICNLEMWVQLKGGRNNKLNSFWNIIPFVHIVSLLCSCGIFSIYTSATSVLKHGFQVSHKVWYQMSYSSLNDDSQKYMPTSWKL